MKHLIAGLICGLICTTAAIAQQRAFMNGQWSVVPSPNAPPEPLGNTLLDVEAITTTDVWAVGFHHNPAYCTFCPAPLAMHWDGVDWSILDTPTIAQPKVKLTSVAAVSSNDVWAVGHWINDTALSGGTVIEHWDGTSWSVVPSPNPGMFNALYGVAAVATNDIWAVGDTWLSWSQKVPLILHYNGKEWTEVEYPSIEYGELVSVFALAADDIWAVGVQGVLSTGIQGLALHWDGTSWTEVPVPNESDGYISLYSVSGHASDDVWAVGVYKFLNWQGHQISRSRAWHWDGTAWTMVLSGLPDSRFYDVHAVASDDVWIAGGWPVFGGDVGFVYATMRWDGVSWNIVETPNQGVLYAVTAASESDAWAVGFGFDDLGFSTGTHTLRFMSPCLGDVVSSATFQSPPDGMVDGADLAYLLGAWGTADSVVDFVTSATFQPPPDGLVDGADLAVLLGAWGPCE